MAAMTQDELLMLNARKEYHDGLTVAERFQDGKPTGRFQVGMVSDDGVVPKWYLNKSTGQPAVLTAEQVERFRQLRNLRRLAAAKSPHKPRSG